MFTVYADNQWFFAAHHIYFPSFGSMFKPYIIFHSVPVVFECYGGNFFKLLPAE
jgi:hypothetical protein